jgi:hypothetical protein
VPLGREKVQKGLADVGNGNDGLAHVWVCLKCNRSL